MRKTVSLSPALRESYHKVTARGSPYDVDLVYKLPGRALTQPRCADRNARAPLTFNDMASRCACTRTLRSARSPCSTGLDRRYSALLVCAKAFRSKRVCGFTVELGVYHEHALVQCRKFLPPPTTRRPKLCRVFRALRQRSRLCHCFLRLMMQRSAPLYLTLPSARIPFAHRYRCPLTPPIAFA